MEPGLVVDYELDSFLENTTFTLDEAVPGMEQITINFFKIWTEEENGQVDLGEDDVPKPIIAKLDFSSLLGTTTDVAGTTLGQRFGSSGGYAAVSTGKILRPSSSSWAIAHFPWI